MFQNRVGAGGRVEVEDPEGLLGGGGEETDYGRPVGPGHPEEHLWKVVLIT